ncbi:MAG: hypothetical protein RLZZ28_879, partial [Bacteroidota bacterium]
MLVDFNRFKERTAGFSKGEEVVSNAILPEQFTISP